MPTYAPNGDAQAKLQEQLIGLPRLADLSIENPTLEKEFLDRGWLVLQRHLAKRVGGEGRISQEERRLRIAEIHRRCHEEAAAEEQSYVLGDFVASFPHLAFQASLFIDVVTKAALTADFSTDGLRSKTLRALAKGLRRAATPMPRQGKPMRDVYFSCSGLSHPDFRVP